MKPSETVRDAASGSASLFSLVRLVCRRRYHHNYCQLGSGLQSCSSACAYSSHVSIACIRPIGSNWLKLRVLLRPLNAAVKTIQSSWFTPQQADRSRPMVEAQPLPPLPGGASKTERAAQYDAVLERLRVLLQGDGRVHHRQQPLRCRDSKKQCFDPPCRRRRKRLGGGDEHSGVRAACAF